MDSNATTVNNLYIAPPPVEYRELSKCPHCGAPIYADARCFKGKKVITLPTSYFTCTCRFNQMPYAQPFVPAPVQPPWYPPVFPPVNPSPTWIVTLPQPNTVNPQKTGYSVPPTTTAVPNGPSWDWTKTFCQSGGISAKPNKNICINAVSPISMASGAMPSLRADILR